ncbi:ATV_HP_G0013760.mRNA.1.CDS.1 [Saccharomyces cerevisiae]|nr:ATV_HP_G0013760.mRNA.1.CDS.1 [Saccharomyces cerevisiae]CAI6948639.1 ATV_HP_G0013760.mRNA.1.CDS.1 [Saccharomyces cerevisiae]
MVVDARLLAVKTQNQRRNQKYPCFSKQCLNVSPVLDVKIACLDLNLQKARTNPINDDWYCLERVKRSLMLNHKLCLTTKVLMIYVKEFIEAKIMD